MKEMLKEPTIILLIIMILSVAVIVGLDNKKDVAKELTTTYIAK